MRRQGGFFYRAKIIIILAAVGAGFFCGEKVWAAVDHLVINEIQADSINGTGGDKDNWIELYNPTDNAVDLKVANYRIEKTVTAADPGIVMRIGDNNDGSYPGGTIIPARGFYLIVRDDANDTLKSKADAIGTSDNFTWTGTKYTFYLGTGAISSDIDSDIIDKVGFGSAKYYEGSGPAPAIAESKSIERQSIGQDTNNNSVDFFIQESPNPQNSTTHNSSPPPPL